MKKKIRKQKSKKSKKAIFEKKMREYRAFLKNDYDWDYGHILRLLKYKLERTRKCILSNDIFTSAPKIGKQIKQVEKLLERVYNDRYYDEISKEFHRKYGRLKMITGKSELGTKYSSLTFKYTKETSRNSKKIRKEFRRLIKKENQMRLNDLRRAFNLMHKNIWGWWD